MTRSTAGRTIVGVLALAVCAPLVAQREPHGMFLDRIGLTDNEIQQIDSGQVFTKLLQSTDEYGLLVFGAAYINAPVEKFAEVFRDVAKLEEEKVYLAVQQFELLSKPATADDFKRMELDKGDIDGLEKCKPGDCDLQLMSAENLD